MKPLFVYLQYLAPQQLLSRCAGFLADCEVPFIKDHFINWFVKRYDVDMTQAAEPDQNAYESFNAFFTRALNADARPIDNAIQTLVSPADGAISALGEIRGNQIFQAKGRHYNLSSLLGGDREAAELFRFGEFATIYLSPRDYHRVHMPIDGELTRMIYVPGDLFSVNNTTAEHVDNLFARNERLICLFDTPQGQMAMILVGAMIVAGIETVWAGQVAPKRRQIEDIQYPLDNSPIKLTKGEEMGRFKLGSTVILLFEPNKVSWNDDLQAGSSLEMGKPIATIR